MTITGPLAPLIDPCVASHPVVMFAGALIMVRVFMSHPALEDDEILRLPRREWVGLAASWVWMLWFIALWSIVGSHAGLECVPPPSPPIPANALPSPII